MNINISGFAPRFELNLLMVHEDCETKIDLFSDLKIYHVLLLWTPIMRTHS